LTITAMTEHAMSQVPAVIRRAVPKSDRETRKMVAHATV